MSEILYISHGETKTGGYFHESQMCSNLGQTTEVRFEKNYRGIWQWIRLFIQAFAVNNHAPIIVTVARLAWPVALKNAFQKKKIILVLHNFDPNDGKPKLYGFLLRKYLRFISNNPHKYALVVVSEYWKEYFRNNFGNAMNIWVYPNLFASEKYYFFRDISKKEPKLIHLGMYSEKADLKAYRNLIFELKKKGYSCYFSSSSNQEISDVPISYFPTHEAFVKQMARSRCTVILNKVNEGWPRLVHESFLCGTQVISTGGGGLDDLLNCSNGYKITQWEEVLELLEGQDFKPIHYVNLEQFDTRNKAGYLAPITQWIQA
jgi:glycosyltransferase involved in cell wall biosynthesis